MNTEEHVEIRTMIDLETLSEGLPGDVYIARGGRTGRKIHLQLSGSSCLACGKWVKADYTIPNPYGRVPVSDLCQKCFHLNTRRVKNAIVQ